MNIKPVGPAVLIKLEKTERTTEGGIIIPESAADKQEYGAERGEVIAVGDGFFHERSGPIPKVGQKVLFQRYSGALIEERSEVDGKREVMRYRIMNDENIFAVLE